MTSGDLAPRNVVNHPVSSAEVGCTERTSSSKVIPIFSIFVRRRRLRLRAANNVKAPTEKEYRPKLAKPSRELKLAETTDVSSSSIKVISKEIAAKNSTKQIIQGKIRDTYQWVSYCRKHIHSSPAYPS